MRISGPMAHPVFRPGYGPILFEAVDARQQCERDPDGNLIAVILHQAGQTRAPRID
jgi:hypothetical protein